MKMRLTFAIDQYAVPLISLVYVLGIIICAVTFGAKTGAEIGFEIFIMVTFLLIIFCANMYDWWKSADMKYAQHSQYKTHLKDYFPCIGKPRDNTEGESE